MKDIKIGDKVKGGKRYQKAVEGIYKGLGGYNGYKVEVDGLMFNLHWIEAVE